MAESNLTHPTYKFVEEKDADAFAWLFTEPKGGPKKVPIQFPALKPNELRAKVTFTGLCHSDIHTVRGDWGPCPYPMAPGHEICGVVTHLGSDVKDFKIGDRVGFGTQRDACGHCDPCKENSEQICEKGDHIYTYGNKYWGGYCSALQQPADFFFKLPEGLPEEKIPPLFCAGITTYNPVVRWTKPGQEVAVLGIGGLGHLAVMYAKAWGCKVTAFTSSHGKEEFIKKLGADKVVVSTEETLKQEAGKYHVVLNTLPNGDNFNAWVGLCKINGVFVQLGVPAFAQPSEFNFGVLPFRQIIVTGSGTGSRKDVREMLEFSAKHNVVPLCEQFNFEEFPQAFEKLEHGKPIFRCVVDATKAFAKQA